MSTIENLHLLTGIVWEPNGKGYAEVVSPEGVRYISFETISHEEGNRFKILEDRTRFGSPGESVIVTAPRYLAENHLSNLLGKPS